MNKGNIAFGIVGLLVGLVVGFLFANSVNKSEREATPDQTSSNAGPIGNSALPPDHPPLTQTGGQSQNAPIPEVTAAIEKARAEPQNFDAQLAAGDLYYQIGRFEDAAKFFEVANKLKPSHSETMIKAGNAYFDAEQYEKAEKWYLLALKKEPKNVNVRTDLGLSFALRSPPDNERAINEYKIALDIDQNNEFALQNLALAYDDKGDKENSLLTIEKLKKVNPNNQLIRKMDGELQK